MATEWQLCKLHGTYWPSSLAQVKLPHGCQVLLFLVTTSLCQDQVTCAPAAFLGCGTVALAQAPSPGSNPDSPLPVIATVGQYRRKLIGQKLE